MRIALYQPDIPQNTGTIARLAACMGVPLDIVGPAGFDMSDRALRRAGMDYLSEIDLTRHLSWDTFYADTLGVNTLGVDTRGVKGFDKADDPKSGQRGARRLVLLTTAASQSYLDFNFAPGDTLLLGRESCGVPESVHEAADARITIPMCSGFRSLNIAVACAMVLGEALRQTGGMRGGERG